MIVNLKRSYLDGKLVLMMGNILELKADAIVNPANISLLGGGGLDGQIHRAAGAAMTCDAQKLGGCDIGDAKVTRGHRLPCKHIIHAVGPAWFDFTPDVVESKLRQTYRSILRVADELEVETLAIPAIGTGIFKIPTTFASRLLFEEIRGYLATSGSQLSISVVHIEDQKYQEALQAFETIHNLIGRQT